jgi:hypothetical protein
MNYSFDYDNTLIKYKGIRDSEGNLIDVVYDGPHYENISILRKLSDEGHTIYIITSRVEYDPIDFKFDWDTSPLPQETIRNLKLPVEAVVYTNGRKKLEKLLLYRIKKHWDDDIKECEEIIKYNELSYPKFIGHQIEYCLVDVEEGLTVGLREKFLRNTANEDSTTKTKTDNS